MGPIDLIPAKYRIAALALAILLAVLAIYSTGHHYGAKSVQSDWDKAKLKQEQVARETEQGWEAKYQGAIDERTKTEQALDSARAAATAANDRLRIASGDFQRRLSDAPAEAARAAARAATGLLGECSAAYQQVAAAADGHLADVRQCEAAWPE